MKILSVDDDPVFLSVIRAELEGLGYSDVHQVSSGTEALNLVRSAESEFDCCLLDIDMPGMNGVELCAHLRSEPRTQTTPIIMVTSRAEMESVDRAFSAGATDYLNKPLNRLELRGRLKMAEGIANGRSGNSGASDGGVIDINEAIRLDPASGCIDYVAIQNFILKLGAMQMFNRVVLGIHVQNIYDIYVTKDSAGFRDTLTDVAEIIVDGLGSCPKVMSYAGGGDFVVLMGRTPMIDYEQLVDSVNLSLEQLGDWYAAFGEVAPSIRIGTPISRSLLSLVAPDEVLDKAIENARASDKEVTYEPARAHQSRNFGNRTESSQF